MVREVLAAVDRMMQMAPTERGKGRVLSALLTEPSEFRAHIEIAENEYVSRFLKPICYDSIIPCKSGNN